MIKLSQFLSGKKTYIIAFATITYALIGFYLHNLDLPTAANMVLGALGLSSLRSGVQKAEDAAAVQ